jgi:hypothetical protein
MLSLILVLALATPKIEATLLPKEPTTDFASMRRLVGTWSCSVKSSRRPAPFQTRSTYALEPSNHWMTETTITEPVPWHPIRFTTSDKITFDGSAHKWIDLSTDELGGYSISTSRGWNGNRITWKDATYLANGTASFASQTTVTVDGASMKSLNTFKEDNGRVISVVGTCKKI